MAEAAKLLEAFPAQAAGDTPVAVIDIGSNSVRLVVYEGARRNPTPLFNEKVLCGLGESIASTGRLPDAAVERAVLALRRFRALADMMRAGSFHVVATAAVREAANGKAFVDEVEAICRTPVEILSGQREAHLAALGIVSGVWRPDGIVGDLGGGSLELVDVRGRKVGAGVTLPLGGLRLQDVSGKSPKKAATLVRDAMADCPVLDAGEGRDFYAIGGTWRSLGRLHMFQTNYPLHVMHEYAIDAKEAVEFARLVARSAPETLAAIQSVSEARRPLLAYGALVLEQILKRGKVRRVLFSAVGVREGVHYESLDDAQKWQDPLLVAAAEYAQLRARSPRHAEELIDWTARLLEAVALDETEDERRLREAACLLSDIGWRAHPDYRGEQSLNVIAHAAFVGVSHEERAFLALSVYHRHVGLDDPTELRIRELCSPRLLERARILGAAFRVASLLTASMAGVIGRTPISVAEGKLVLQLGGELAALNGRRVQNRFRALGKILGLDVAVIT